MDESAWVERAQAGDQEAFESLLAPHREKLARYIAARVPASLKRKINAEDVLQEASLTAYQRIGTFEHRGDGAFRAWLFQIAQRKLQEAIRHFAGTEKRAGAAEIPRGQRRDTRQFVGRRTTPSQRMAVSELGERLERAMALLSEDYRTVLHLVQTEGQTLRDAAEVLDRSYEATKKLYARAVEALADALDASAGSEGAS